MENAKKQLKLLSLIIFIFAAISAVQMVIGMFNISIDPAQIPENLTMEIVKISYIITLVIGFIVLIPQLYVGYKGLKVSKSNDGSGAHIIWATILLVFSVINLISSVSALFSAGNLWNDILTLIITACDVAIYFLYIKYAKQIKAAA